MNEIVNAINGVIWSPALIYLCLGVGLYFSLRTRFLQLRHIKEMVRLMFDGKSTDAGVSSFQALAMTLAGRVGTGNIAGVATAITFGGPGALFLDVDGRLPRRQLCFRGVHPGAGLQREDQR